MRLVPKLTLAFVAGMALILAGNAYFRIRREIALFESDRALDDKLLGTALGAAVTAVWKFEGGWRAMAVVDQANVREGKVRIRWTPLSDFLRTGGQDELGLAGDPVVRVTTDRHGQKNRSTYVPVVLEGSMLGALEISESFASEQAYVQKTVIDTILTALTLAGVCTGLAMLLSVWLVGRPVTSLIAKARQVGRGDFSSPIQLRGRGEFAELGNEMNAMCDRLVQTLDQLRHADRLATVGKLSSGLAHELGTPLNVISARAEMIASGDATGVEATEYAKIIVHASERMAGIVRRLLEFARRKELQKESQDLQQLAVQTLDLLKPLAQKNRTELRMGGGASSVVADVDGGQFQQVLTNLLMNAVHAMHGPGNVDVAISTERVEPPADHGGPAGDYVCVSVTDHGVGMTAEQMTHIFEPFFTTKEVGEGTGLGLSVAYGIVRDHGGWISVQSELAKGSRFAVYLPKGGT